MLFFKFFLVYNYLQALIDVPVWLQSVKNEMEVYMSLYAMFDGHSINNYLKHVIFLISLYHLYFDKWAQ